MKRNIKQKPISIVILALMLILMLSTYGHATSETKDLIEINYLTHVEKTLISLFENKDLGYNDDLSEYVDPNLLVFLEGKVATHQYSTELHNINKTNYKIKTTLLEEKKLMNKIYLQFNVQTSFNYVDLPNIDSGNGTIVEVLIDSNNYKILDIYDQYNYYDSFVRGESVDIIKENSNEMVATNSKTMEEKRIQLQNIISEIYEEERNNVWESYENLTNDEFSSLNGIYEEENNNTLESYENLTNDKFASRSSLAKQRIVNYARNNYNKTNPASGNGVVNYYDFSQISGNYDCTNFVSHALLAGGATVYDTGNPSTGWYYRNLSNRSYSWAGVINLHTFLTTNRTKGPYGTSSSYGPIYGDFPVGDIIQFHNGSVWRHSTIVTGSYYFGGGGLRGALVTGRTAPGVYNDNDKVVDIYPGHSKRVIVLSGNY